MDESKPNFSIEELCARHLHGRPSPQVLAQLKRCESQREEVREFVARVFRLMEVAHFDAKNISPVLAFTLGSMISAFLPGGYGGSIPPFTWEQRHKDIEPYLAHNRWAQFGPGTTLLEMGCGFPPLTAVDAARAHPDWRITGADPCFDEYLLRDERDNYACLSHEGVIRYFHSGSTNPADIFTLYKDRQATLERFSQLFEKLKPNLAHTKDGQEVSVGENGTRLIRHPLRSYESENLRLMQAGIGSELPGVNIVRCFNVLLYFDDGFRRLTEEWALRTLKPGGLFLCGGDSAATMEARYSVYRREEGRLVPKEFAFSVDNVQGISIAPWFAMHDGELETWALAKLTRILRADDNFRDTFDARNDVLLAEKKMFVRDSEGYLTSAPDQIPQTQWIESRAEIVAQFQREGFPARAVAVLRDAGVHAWVNEVGHVAVDPADIP